MDIIVNFTCICKKDASGPTKEKIYSYVNLLRRVFAFARAICYLFTPSKICTSEYIYSRVFLAHANLTFLQFYLYPQYSFNGIAKNVNKQSIV